MNIALVQQHVDIRRGGAETSTVEMARHLARLGLNVTVLCRGPLFPTAAAPAPRLTTVSASAPPSSPPVASASTFAPGFEPFLEDEVIFRPLPAPARTRAGRTLAFVRAADRFCRREQFDIVHAITPCISADVYQPRGGTYPETIARSLAPTRSPLARGVRRLGRSFNLSQRFLYWLEQTLLIKYQSRVWVAALSEYVRRQVETGFRFPPEQIRVIFNGVDIEPLAPAERLEWRTRLRSRLGLSGEASPGANPAGERSATSDPAAQAAPPLVLFVAHNFRLKGLRELLRAMAHSETNWQLAIAGRDDTEPYVRRARRLGVAGRVHFVGTDTPMRGWYAAADVLAHPTWYDPCSRVVLEALSLGLPVVTTRFNGAAEVIEQGRHGEVIDTPADIRGLAAAIERCLERDVREGCAADAPRMAERLSMARHARELVALYDEISREKEAIRPSERDS